MSHKKKNVLLALSLVGIYIICICLLVGTFFIYIGKHKGRTLIILDEVIQKYTSSPDHLNDEIIGSERKALIYDTSGNLVNWIIERGALPTENTIQKISHYINPVHSGKKVWFLSHEDYLNDITLTVGGPVVQDGTVIAEAFVVVNLKNLPELATYSFIFFTFLYVVFVIFIEVYFYKKRKLDENQKMYIANVTHSLKTPIAAVKTLIESLCDGVITDPDKIAMYYGLILRETNQQARMVQQLLDLSKLQSNSMDMEKKDVYAADFLNDIIDHYDFQFEYNDVSFHIDTDVSTIPQLHTNVQRLRQVFEVILDNAVKYVPAGHNVWLSTKSDKMMVTFCIKDDGPGIEHKQLSHIFDRFYTAGNADIKNGTGLGLSIAKGIMEGLKEKLWAESEPGSGTAFYFTVHTSGTN